MCGQHFQQTTIDRAKGIITKPMPSYWFSIRDNIIKDDDTDEIINTKTFNRRITAAHKPYFMTYVYPSLKASNNTYNANSNNGALMRFYSYGITNMDDLYNYEQKTPEMNACLKYYEKKVGYNPCTVNRICWFCEKHFEKYLSKQNKQNSFDYTILKSNVEYCKSDYIDILNIYKAYKLRMDSFQKKNRSEKLSVSEILQQRKILIDKFKFECESICNNEDELCDIVLDICYKTERAKQFAWDICGETILRNLLIKRDRKIYFPKLVDYDGEFEYGGNYFIMASATIGDDYNNYTE